MSDPNSTNGPSFGTPQDRTDPASGHPGDPSDATRQWTSAPQQPQSSADQPAAGGADAYAGQQPMAPDPDAAFAATETAPWPPSGAAGADAPTWGMPPT